MISQHTPIITDAPDRLQWVRNGLTLFTADDYNSKVLSERGGAGQRVGYTKTGPRASPNRITQNHSTLTKAVLGRTVIQFYSSKTSNTYKPMLLIANDNHQVGSSPPLNARP